MFQDNRINDRDMYSTEKTEYGMHKETKMMDTNGMGMMGACHQPHMGCGCVCPPIIEPPVIECPQIKILNQHIIHEVPHIVPVNTKIIKHHIYKHHYQPQYSACEENVVTNVVEPPCGPCGY